MCSKLPANYPSLVWVGKRASEAVTQGSFLNWAAAAPRRWGTSRCGSSASPYLSSLLEIDVKVWMEVPQALEKDVGVHPNSRMLVPDTSDTPRNWQGQGYERAEVSYDVFGWRSGWGMSARGEYRISVTHLLQEEDSCSLVIEECVVDYSPVNGKRNSSVGLQ